MKDCTFKETTETKNGIILRFLEAFLRGLAENEIFMWAKKRNLIRYGVKTENFGTIDRK
jgi:hypothetical protein